MSSLLVYKLGAENEFKVLHTLTGHKLKVRSIRLNEQFAVSGSWDRTAILWNIISGQSVRVLKHEMQVFRFLLVCSKWYFL